MIHGWDIRTAFDDAAALSERPLPVLVGLAQRWLSNTFHPVPHLAAPVRYRFDVPGPAPLRQDVLVSQDSFHLVPAADSGADVTFRCHTGDYILLVYGRLPLDRAVDTGRLEMGSASRHASSLRCSRASKQALCEDALMTTSISTQALTGAIEDPTCVVVDVREMAAFNGWICHHEARGGHLRGAVAFPLEWTVVVQGPPYSASWHPKGSCRTEPSWCTMCSGTEVRPWPTGSGPWDMPES